MSRPITSLGTGFVLGFSLTMVGAALDLLRPDSFFLSWHEFLRNWQVAILVATPAAIVAVLIGEIAGRLGSQRE